MGTVGQLLRPSGPRGCYGRPVKVSVLAALWVAGVVGGGGCAGPAGQGGVDAGLDAGPVAPVATVGTGVSLWEEIPTAGARMEVVMGPQGGFHVLGRARFRGLPGDVFVGFALRPAGGGEAVTEGGLVRRVDRRGLTRWGDGWETTSAELVILAPGVTPAAVVGRPMRLELTVTDAAGRMATDARDVTLVDEVP